MISQFLIECFWISYSPSLNSCPIQSRELSKNNGSVTPDNDNIVEQISVDDLGGLDRISCIDSLWYSLCSDATPSLVPSVIRAQLVSS